MNILMVEDDARISDFVVRGLKEQGLSIALAETGEEARGRVAEGGWDLIIIDIMLPGIDGLQLIELIRFKKYQIPILVLSALNEPSDRVKGLDLGADDYLAKPFHFPELVSRIRALGRRSKLSYEAPSNVLVCADLSLDLNQYTANRNGVEVALSPREFSLLRCLMENQGKTLSRALLLQRVWDMNHNNLTNVVDVYISYLRSKVDAGHAKKLIHTVKGVGYILKAG